MRSVLLAVLSLSTAFACPIVRADEPDVPACTTSKTFAFPSIYWAGEFGFKTRYQVRSGRATAVDVTAVKGADPTTDQVLIDALTRQISENYRCATPDKDVEEFLTVTVGHDMPELAEGLAQFRLEKAQYDAIKQAAPPGATLPIYPLQRICSDLSLASRPRSTRPPPKLPKGTYKYHVIVEVRDGVVGRVDTKMVQGTQSPQLNQWLLADLAQSIQKGFRCEGNAVVETDLTMVTREVDLPGGVIH